MSLVTPLSKSNSVGISNKDNYIDPILSNFTDSKNDEIPLTSKELHDLTLQFPLKYKRITDNCAKGIKIYKKLLGLKYQLNSWEFLTLKTSIDLNFNDLDNKSRKFDKNIAQSCIDKSLKLDDELSKIMFTFNGLKIFISKLSIDEYISDPGALILKIHFKILNLKNKISEKISIAYTKSKLLIILFELLEILHNLNQEVNPIVRDDTDFQSTLNSYKDFVSNIIEQLDQAVEDNDSDQIEECLNILNDVEKMYESVRVNFIFEDEINEYEQQQQQQSYITSNEEQVISSPTSYEDDYLSYKRLDHLKSPSSAHQQRSRRTSISSSTSSLARHSTMTSTTITDELPYLLQAFDDAKHLEQELSSYRGNVPTAASPSPMASQILNKSVYANSTNTISRPGTSSSTTTTSTILNSINNDSKKKSSLTAGLPSSNIGFNNNLLNSIYGLHPNKPLSGYTTNVFKPSKLHNEVD